MSPPAAVTASAPVGLPPGAAPPGARPASSPASTAELFGMILNTARTAPAEGHQTSSAHAGRSKRPQGSSPTPHRQPQTPNTAALLTATVAFLTGQAAPGAASPTASGSSKATTIAEHTVNTGTGPATTDARQPQTACRRPTATPAAPTAPASRTEPVSRPTASSSSQPAAASLSAPALGAGSGRRSLGAEPVATAASPSSSAAPPSSQAPSKAPAAAAVSLRPGAATPGLADTPRLQATAAPYQPTLGSRDAAQPNASRPGGMPTQVAAVTPGGAAKDAGGRRQSSSERHLGTAWRTPASSLSAPAQASTGQAAAAARFSPAQAPVNLDGAQRASLAQTGVAAARSSVTLQEAVDAVRATFSAVNQAGVSSARITLSPAALGGIKIALSQTPAGLIARVVADHPEAVQTLAQSADELRSSLTQSGVHVLSLEISSSGQHGADGFSRQQGYGAGGPHTNVSAPISEAQQSPPITELTVRLASGSLISVLA